MKVSFLGAARTVTGSNHMVEAAGKKFLIDLGMYQGKATEELDNEEPFRFNVDEIDFVILTHAHIDHSGRIPKLYNEGYRNPVFATKATCDLCSIMLPDSGHIQETEVAWKNKKRIREGKKALPPLYTALDAEKCLEIFKPVKYDEIVEVAENISVRFNDAGHMLGSAIVEIWVTEDDKTTKIVFSGDIGNNDLPLLDSPTMIASADYLVMESTYGNRLHVKNDQKAEDFLNIVSQTLDNGGTVVIPSFAVGRTQEILYEIDKLKDEKGLEDEEFAKKYKTVMEADVFVDSPLAISATEIFKKNSELFSEEVRAKIESGEDYPLDFPGLSYTVTPEESRELNSREEPCIILSAAGMCDVGRIKHHLKHNLWKPTSTILFVGYQAPGTLGRSIIDGAKKVKIFGEEIAVNARIEYIEGFSGHADQEWLLNFVYSFRNRPKHIFLVHGEEESEIALKEKIEQTIEIKTTIPTLGETYVLDGTDTPKLELDEEEQAQYEKMIKKYEVLDNIDELMEKMLDMESAVKENKIDTKDEDISVLSDRVKELQEHINKIINEK